MEGDQQSNRALGQGSIATLGSADQTLVSTQHNPPIMEAKTAEELHYLAYGDVSPMKLFLISEHIAVSYLSLHLRTQQDVDNIVGRELANCRDDATRRMLQPSMRKAVLGVPLITMDISFERARPSAESASSSDETPTRYTAIIRDDLYEASHMIGNLELRIRIDLSESETPTTGWLMEATLGMASLKERFPNLISLFLVFDITGPYMTREEALAHALPSYLRGDRSGPRSDKALSEMAADLVRAMKEEGPGKDQYVSASVGVGVSRATGQGSELPNERIHITELGNVDRVLHRALQLCGDWDSAAY